LFHLKQVGFMACLYIVLQKFETQSVVDMNSSVFWVIMWCKVVRYRYSGTMYWSL
jgi:hypothetical protein